MFSSKLALLTVFVAATACSGAGNETLSPAASLPVDVSVTEMLPIGPHEVSIVQNIDAVDGPRSVTVSGYLDLGADPFGRDCVLDLELVEDVDGSVSTFLARRAVGQEAYHQIVEGDSENNVAFDPGTWYAATSPAIPGPVFFFGPNFLSEGVGVLDDAPGGYCTWRLLDRVSTLGPDGLLTWNFDAVAVLLEAGVRNYASDVLGDGQADRLLDEEGMVPAPSERLLGTLRVEKDLSTGVITMQQSYDELETKVFFTPTEARTVEPVTPS